MSSEPLLQIRALRKHFPVPGGLFRRRQIALRALDGIDLDLHRGETVGLVGESGGGKTTLGRCALRLVEPTAGSIFFRGEDLGALGSEALRRRRRYLQMIFQDPDGSLNPRMRVGDVLHEPLVAHRIVPKAERHEEVRRLLNEVGLTAAHESRFPHQLSGGQRQRVAIARALATRPELVIADEPVSALDASVQAQIINLLMRLCEERELATLFIAHDLSVVERVSNRLCVLYLGRIVETGPVKDLLRAPLHPYTAALISAVPVIDPDSGRRRLVLPGDPPDPALPPSGCAFHSRCPIAKRRCRTDAPQLLPASLQRQVSCHYPGGFES